METVLERFFKYIVPEPNTGCWLWTGNSDIYGYGKFRVERKTRTSHRFSWELHNGPIPKGLHILHNCDTPACCNPLHLRIGTHQENVADCVMRKRFKGKAQINRDKTHCPKGHPYDEVNTRISKIRNNYFGRVCRKCDSDKQKQIRKLKRRNNGKAI